MALTSKDRQLCSKPRPLKGRKRCKKGEKAKPALGNGDTCFLKHTFASVVAVPPVIDAVKKAEGQFRRSLKYFNDLYGSKMVLSKERPFPLNVQDCLEEAKKVSGISTAAVMDDAGTLRLVTFEVFPMDYLVHYIPIKPLVDLIREKRTVEAGLLTGIFSYLYKVLAFPYYREEETYLYYSHQYVRDLADDDMYADYEEKISYLPELALADYWGDKVEMRIRHPWYLDNLEYIITHYKAKKGHDTYLCTLSEWALTLFKRYPAKKLFDVIPYRFIDPEIESNERITADQYISFCWSREGNLYESLCQQIDVDFQEKITTDEPIAIKVFNAPHKEPCHDMSFCKEVFDFLAQLEDYLN